MAQVAPKAITMVTKRNLLPLHFLCSRSFPSESDRYLIYRQNHTYAHFLFPFSFIFLCLLLCSMLLGDALVLLSTPSSSVEEEFYKERDGERESAEENASEESGHRTYNLV